MESYIIKNLNDITYLSELALGTNSTIFKLEPHVSRINSRK